MLRRAHADERGATAVLVGLLLPTLLAAGALGVGVTALGAGERELQRSADAAALAGAARMPLADSGALTATGPLPHADGAADTAEAFCADNLAEARMTQAFGSGTPACDAEVEPDDPSLLSTLTGAVDDLADDASLLDELGLSGAAELDPAAVAPALAHPRVRVADGDTYRPPLGGLLGADTVETTGEGVARRRIKNAVLVPVVDLEATCPEDGLLGALTGTLADLLSDSTDLPPDVAEFVEDDCTVDANPVLDMTGDEVFDQLEGLEAPLDAAGLPGTEIVDGLMLDLRDVYDPDGDAPTQREVLDEAADGDEDVFVLVTGTTDATAIPILDAVHAPAGAVRDWLDDDAADIDGAYDVATTAAEGRGLFRASLVE